MRRCLRTITLALLTCLPLPAQATPVVAGLELWLRADLGVTTAGSAVSTWADQSGNGHDFVQATTGQRPTLTSDADFGGAAAIAFDGADDQLRNADQIVGGDAFTLFTVAKISPLTSPYPYAFGETILARMGYEGPPFTPLANDGFDVFHDFHNDARATLAGLSDGNAKIVTISGSGTMSSVQVWGDGVAAAMTLTNADTAISFSSGNTLGFAHTCGSDCNGDPIFAEILLYDRALDADERLAVEAYLFERYFAVAEPGSASLLGLGALGLAARGRRGRHAR